MLLLRQLSMSLSVENRGFTDLAPNKITGANAGGPRHFSGVTPLAARVAQFCR